MVSQDAFWSQIGRLFRFFLAFAIPEYFVVQGTGRHLLRASLYLLAIIGTPFLLVVICNEVFYGLNRAGKYLFRAKRCAVEAVADVPLLNTTERKEVLVQKPQFEPTVDQGESANGSNGRHPEQVQLPPIVEPSQPDSVYMYSALQKADIRLLQILPATTDSSPLRFRVIHVPLLTARARLYTALSYTWGAGAATTTIFLNDREMRIRPNLAHSLRKMRSLHYDFIWVDAICINQADLKECSDQVLRMRGIYSGASSVLITVDLTREDENNILQVLALADSPQHIQVGVLPDPVSAFYTFCNNDYWNRIWIVQEFAIGHPVKLLIGESVVGVEKVSAALELLELKPHVHHSNRAKSIFGIRASWQKHKPLPLVEMLYETRESLCGKRHDRVFGLMGLVNDGLEFLPEPSYQVDLTNLSISMTRSYIERCSLNIILLAPYSELESTVPSWSPDYFRLDRYPPDHRTYHLYMSHRLRHITYGCSEGQNEVRKWSATGEAPGAVSFNDTTLGFSARRISFIRSLGRAWSDPAESTFPDHDTAWAQRSTHAEVTKIMYDAVLREAYSYNKPEHRMGSCSRLIGTYCFTHAFLEDHGKCDPENMGNKFTRWLCANRKFFVGGRSLGDHAKQLHHPFFHCGLGAWGFGSWPKIRLFEPLEKMASNNMRLMCLDDASFGIGWASLGARVNDEIFLVAGCSTPIILRRHEADGHYKLVGDAVVIGAMKNEVWGTTTPADLVDITIH